LPAFMVGALAGLVTSIAASWVGLDQVTAGALSFVIGFCGAATARWRT